MIIRRKVLKEYRYEQGKWYEYFCWLPKWVPVDETGTVVLVWLHTIEVKWFSKEKMRTFSTRYKTQWRIVSKRLLDG